MARCLFVSKTALCTQNRTQEFLGTKLDTSRHLLLLFWIYMAHFLKLKVSFFYCRNGKEVFHMNTPIPNAARILGQTGVLRADDGGRRRIGRCGHSLFGKAGMDGEQCHYQQHQSAAQQADIHITFPIVHSETPLFHFCPARRTRFRCGGPTDVSYPLLRTPSICPQQNNKMQKSPERYRSRLLCLYVHIIL